ISTEKLVGATRKQDVATARHVSMYLSKSLTGAPLKAIGVQFGNRDHTTVIHACRSVEKKLSKDPEFEDLVNQLQNQIIG
ncbi:MAG: chromosomal replication initiator protein DnaA, partial [Candidatus Latescibacteria bacterium]|nr:chromosomal replication initiator protein DnaA [Candidatus Latescibacterota bacterium]